MDSIKKTSASKEEHGSSGPEPLTQTVRIAGQIQRIPVGGTSFHLGNDSDDDGMDLTAGVTEEDLMDHQSGVGKQLSQVGIGDSAVYQNEIAMAAKVGVQARKVTRSGGSIHISQAIDSAENDLSRNLIAGWERDPEFSSIVAEHVSSTYGFDLQDVQAAIRTRAQ